MSLRHSNQCVHFLISRRWLFKWLRSLNPLGSFRDTWRQCPMPDFEKNEFVRPMTNLQVVYGVLFQAASGMRTEWGTPRAVKRSYCSIRFDDRSSSRTAMAKI